ncbi:MAG: sce7726 family protein [Lachnospiraceae bacterium]|uniref:sce7726 family protein n=1 Tax=Candidatus Merdisoma sp. JLR.KK011 TaxID=3114299 RepID=UPI002FF3E1E6|nr:sce7726 family protein [Lachnospiraceae bacterium]MCI9479499.1 sce7726 family protein [Lachnospiraceae bacterium]
MLYDKDIREPLFDYLEERYGKARMIEEKQMGRSRADIVMVLQGELAGIEIKSDADTYARLKRQVKDYDRFFDRNYVVAGSTHAMHIGEHVPEYWGIISVEQMEEGVDFYMIREAARNPKMELELKLRILWRPELAHIQAICGMAKYGGKSKEFVRNKIAEGVPAEILNELISEELFERDYTEIRGKIEEFRGRRKK